MKEKLDMFYLKVTQRLLDEMERLGEEEKGASDIVAILLVIVILVAVAAIFREQLMGAVTTAFGKLNEALGG